MFIQSMKYDYQTAGILVEYVTKAEARQMSHKLIKAIFEKGGELNKFEGFISGVFTVENYLMVGTDLGADELDQIMEFIKSSADPDQYDENDYEQKETNEDFSMGVSGPTGLNQGIPHGGPGKGCLPKPLYNPKAKAVPPKKEEDKDTEKNKKEMEKAKAVIESAGLKLVSESDIEGLEHYLYDLGFEWDEVDALIEDNQEFVDKSLADGLSYGAIAADLDDKSVRQ